MSFPDFLTLAVRGAVSIGRQGLMDPLAELVKIDPKSIGGQYQHDVDQTKLKQSTPDQTVEKLCQPHVGVNLNTASSHLLTYISGLGPQL